MRILWHSHSPLMATGYGQPTALWPRKLKDMGHDVIISAFLGLPTEISMFNGIPVVNSNDDKYGSTALAGLARGNGVDLVIALMDQWALQPHDVNAVGVPVVNWSTVDCYPLGARDRDYLRKCSAYPVAPSYWGQKVFQEAGFDAGVMLYAVNPKIFHPDEERREEMLRKLGVEDKFVVGINAANVERKALAEQIAGFARLYKEHPGEVTLLAHTNGVGAYPVSEIAYSFGLPDDAFIQTVPGYYDQYDLADWYRALDVLSACVKAEGFGVPIVEAQACGVPVIVSDIAPINEETGLLGRKVKCDPIWSPMHNSWWAQPSVSSIYEQLEFAFAEKREGPDLEAVEYVKKYFVDNVAPMWEPILRKVTGQPEPVVKADAPAPQFKFVEK